MSRHSPECSGSIAMILLRQMRSIMVSFTRIKRCRQNAGVVRGLHFQIPPAAQAKIGARIDLRRRGQYPLQIAGLRPTVTLLRGRRRSIRSESTAVARRPAGGPCARRSPRI